MLRQAQHDKKEGPMWLPPAAGWLSAYPSLDKLPLQADSESLELCPAGIAGMWSVTPLAPALRRWGKFVAKIFQGRYPVSYGKKF